MRSRRARDELGIRLPVVPENCEQTYHMFYVLMPDRPTRDAVLSGMREHEHRPTFHYVPLHSSEAGRKFSRRTPSARSPTTSAAGWSGCRSTTT